LVFYFRYQNKDVVNELRSNLKEANNEIHNLSQDLEEYMQQNTILKHNVSELLDKNDDLSGVVSELSKYYVHIKRAAEKTSELTKFLQNPNPDMEEKIR
jgi:arginine deiminase